MIGHHFSISALWCAPSASGVCCSRGTIVLPDLRKPRPHRRIGQRLDRRGVELGDGILRRALRHPEPVPERHLEARQTGLVDGRNVGRRRPAGLGQHRIGLDLAAAADAPRRSTPRRSRGRSARRSGPARRGGAAIGHELEFDAELLLEVDGPDLRRTADADRAERGAVSDWPSSRRSAPSRCSARNRLRATNTIGADVSSVTGSRSFSRSNDRL